MTTATTTIRRRWWFFLPALLAISQAGCLLAAAGAAAGAGAYAYYRGNVSEPYAVEFGEAYQASKEALLDMAMPVLHEDHRGLTGTIESSLQDGTKVTLSLEEKPRLLTTDDHQTEVGVRIGTFGDERVSTKILQQISVRVAQRMKATGRPAGASPERLPPITPASPTPPITPAQGTSNPAPIQQTGATGPWKPAGQPNQPVEPIKPPQ